MTIEEMIDAAFARAHERRAEQQGTTIAPKTDETHTERLKRLVKGTE